jgi:hypothetical protein
LVLVASPESSRAQDSVVARLRTRADSLLREWRQADGIADLVDSLERERASAGRDTIAVGALRIVVNPSPLPLREAAARAWPVIDSLYGPVAAELSRRPYLIRAVDPDTAVPRGVFHVGVEVPWDLDVEAVTAFLLTNIPMPQPDGALAQWLGTSIRPTGRPQQDRAAVYVQLVTAPSQAARRCFLGDIAACEDALELNGGASPLERWYPSPKERRAVVTGSFSGFFDHGATAAALRACAAGNDAPCTELLRSLPPNVLPKPLGHDARATLVDAAIRLGGRDAYRRLLASPSVPIRDRLAAAAGIDADSLVARWRAEVVGSRPAPVSLPVWMFGVALGWMAFFATCGLRSSRWRVA